MRKTIRILLAGVMAAALVAGCGKKGENAGKTVATDGSTSMEKVIGILGESFMENHKGVNFTYNPTGSGAGISAVAEGRTDIGLASRTLKEEEKEKGLTETTLALDGIAVIVNQANKIEDLTPEQIASVYKGEIRNWKELGGDDVEIVVIGREAGSGTRDGFESVLKIGEAAKYRQELTSTGDVITTVAGNPGAIGYASIASVKETVVTLSVQGVKPAEETVKDGTYFIQRPFMLITKKDRELSETAKAFFEYITSDKASELIKKAGVVPVK